MGRVKKQMKKKEVDCPRCNGINYNVIGFTVPGEEMKDRLVDLLVSHPEYMDWAEGEGLEN